jgi:calcineurin-like phosphoesterase family protein
MRSWFTSDEHYGHTRIIEYCNRPFSNVTEMNETLIRNHNALVAPEDEVYHLGDFAFRNHAMYLRRLNGRHYLIKGNHEGKDWKDAGFAWVKEVATVSVCTGRLNERQDIFLSHYAHRRWNRAHYGVIHLFGHSHGQLEDYCTSCDVGVDAWDYKPVSFEQLVERFKKAEIVKHH